MLGRKAGQSDGQYNAGSIPDGAAKQEVIMCEITDKMDRDNQRVDKIAKVIEITTVVMAFLMAIGVYSACSL